jgi:hypothetical protein
VKRLKNDLFEGVTSFDDDPGPDVQCVASTQAWKRCTNRASMFRRYDGVTYAYCGTHLRAGVVNLQASHLAELNPHLRKGKPASSRRIDQKRRKQ